MCGASGGRPRQFRDAGPVFGQFMASRIGYAKAILLVAIVFPGRVDYKQSRCYSRDGLTGWALLREKFLLFGKGRNILNTTPDGMSRKQQSAAGMHVAVAI